MTEDIRTEELDLHDDEALDRTSDRACVVCLVTRK